MIDTSRDLTQQYLSGLLHYLAGGGEAALQGAYEAGRRALGEGLGGLEMLAIHQKCLVAALSTSRTPEEASQMAERAGHFFAESLSPFEMALRGFREANAKLNRKLEDLRAAEEELLNQHYELLAAHQALETERRRYRDLFDFAPDGYLVTDLEGNIEEANRAAEILLGVPSESLPGTRVIQYVAPESHDEFETRLKRLPDDDASKAQDWQFDIRVRTGFCFPATLGVRVVRNASGRPAGLRWLVRDVTERKRIEEERAQFLVREQVARTQSEAAQRFAFLAEISTLLVTSLDCETTLGDVARRMVPYLADGCLLYVVERDNGIRLLGAATTTAGTADMNSRLRCETVRLSAQSAIGRVLYEGHAEIVSETSPGWRESFSNEPESFRFLAEQRLKSIMLVPIETHRGALGLIALGTALPAGYQRDHLALAEDIARRCALAMDNAQLYRAMAAERDKAEEASRAKDEFLGILSHELRNPLVPILGWARSFRKNPYVAENRALRDGVETLERNALNILRLADDCLDLVRISEHKVTLEKELLDLNQTVHGSVEALRQTAHEKGLRLVTNFSPSGLCVLGDRTRLEQVINNLLINAIKYTNPGDLISISSSRVEDDAEIKINDTGIGIDPEFLEQVFQPFRRGSKQWLASDAGLGLGLTIARKIVVLHGGSIWAESPGLGGGSTFYLRLSLAHGAVAVPRAGDAGSRGPAQTGSFRILLIDDQKDVTDLMRMELETLGYSVLTAADGRLGLEMAVREVPDVIVSDIKMPGMDGYELIQHLRRIPNLAAVPVIALTGFGMKKDAEAAISAGYDAHLNKPVEVNELSDLIQKLAHRETLRPGP